jgi:macrolide transport system ATP-binding/permease protein
MTSLWQDVRFSVRLLVKDRMFTGTVIVSLSLAIGANTGVFTFLNALFLRPPGVAAPEHLIAVASVDASDPMYLPDSYPNYLDYRDHNTAFSGLAAFQGFTASLAGGGLPEEVPGQLVTSNYFTVLGVNPILGRAFLPEENLVPDSRPVVVLSHAFWRSRFAADPNIIGKTITLNTYPFTVVGVAPPGWIGPGKRVAFKIWVPIMMYRRIFLDPDHALARGWRLFFIVGRLKPGVAIERATAEMKALAADLEREHPDTNHGQTAILLPFVNAALGLNDRRLFVQIGLLLAAVVWILLLCACSNAANLLLARSAERRREVAVRLALGASRGRLIRQLLTEAVVLSLASGAIGTLLAAWTRNLLRDVRTPMFATEALDATLDLRVLLFALAASLATGLLFGLIPALQLTNSFSAAALANEVHPLGVSRRRIHPGKLITVVQIAFSLVSLVAAGWFLRSLRNAKAAPGFEVSNLLVVSFNLGNVAYSDAQGERFRRLVTHEVSAIPGVRSVAFNSMRLLEGLFLSRSVILEGARAGAGEHLTPTNFVSSEYFKTLGIPILEGRSFTDRDRGGTPPVAVVNEAMAHRFWPGQSPIGKRFRLDDDSTYLTVVGEARDSKFLSLTQPTVPCFYVPLLQQHSPVLTLYVRVDGRPDQLVRTVMAKIRGIEPQLPLDAISATALTAHALWAANMGADLLLAFGALALLLAFIGTYGVISYSVRLRQREIGLRMALGARRIDVIRLILVQGMTLASLGLLLGVAGALLLGVPAAGVLFNVRPADPEILTVSIGILGAAALLASVVPARRAAALDPGKALKGG